MESRIWSSPNWNTNSLSSISLFFFFFLYTYTYTYISETQFQIFLHSQFTYTRVTLESLSTSINKMFLSKLVITNALMLILFLSMYESEGASNSSGSLSVVNGANINPPLAHQTVNVSVYYDSLCQSCAQFIIRDLKNVFDSNLISIMNLRLVPWAKAYINKTNSSISCQV